jgi:hypothetical protein
MITPGLFDVVKLNVDIGECGLNEGDTGTIVECYTRPEEAYEVEFVNPDGSTRVLCVLTPAKFTVTWRALDQAEAEDELGELVVRLQTTGRPIAIIHQNQAQAVLVSFEEYQEMRSRELAKSPQP